ncbi:geranylgeranyl transferase type-2 subunit alpha [Anaeramoeba flamelloides]|uniref:Geranylgeranyl transferase type-2 subunit alpha n=1 Tax=Anaeramoeba flamelloides TaxID=1746091 RepID=A0ABQ8XU36_9EUKA|nr:geranylgeranyl transferase type-2 subunit alpha [Anaeramoeba flamelloides]
MNTKLEGDLKKIDNFLKQRDVVLQRRKEGDLSLDSLELAQKILLINPDVATFWAFIKEIYEHYEATSPGMEKLIEIYKKDRAHVEKCMGIHPKSYYLWHHRRWTSERTPQMDWKKELKLCNYLLTLDKRNFHCWNYRRFVVSQLKLSLKEELDFTTFKIEENFSNYSAWHNRSTIVTTFKRGKEMEEKEKQQEKEEQKEEKKQEQVKEEKNKKTEPQEKEFTFKFQEEFEFVQNALYVDPEDQSTWIYLQWLISQSSNEGKLERINTTIQVVEELLEIEPKSKWGNLTLVFLLREKANKVDDEEKQSNLRNHAKEIINKLIKLDHRHTNFYNDFANSNKSFL